MEDLFESAKRAASNAVERAAWEADKLRRVSERQKELELVRRERAAMMEQLVATVRDLEARGQITQPQLKSLAERLTALERDLANGQSDIQTIKNETYKPGSVSITVQRKDASQPASSAGTYPCPTCGRPVRSSAAFCSACGARLH
jgi:hypothetical protein